MLTQLHIENIAVIEKADIEFGKGLTVLTGETGAGKSIIVDSLGAVLGARTSRELVRTGAEYGVVSAVFETDAAAKWFEDNDFEPEDEIIIRRKISADGKNRRPLYQNISSISWQKSSAALLSFIAKNAVSSPASVPARVSICIESRVEHAADARPGRVLMTMIFCATAYDVTLSLKILRRRCSRSLFRDLPLTT